MDLILECNPDLLCLQEVCPQQFQYIQQHLLEKQFHSVGVPREYDATTKSFYGEAVPIFFRNSKFKLHTQGTFWLSETPSTPGSKSWDSDCTRICTWCRLDVERNRTVFLFNAHWDNIGKVARLHSSMIIKKQMANVLKAYRAEDGPIKRLPLVVLVGDFNSDPVTEEIKRLSVPYVDGESGIVINLKNARDYAHHKEGPDVTFTGFDYQESYHSDYIFFQEGYGTEKDVEKRWKVDKLCVITRNQHDGVTPLSDHRPVLCHMSEIPSIEAKIELSQI
jgi:endonuclease/exonuclease/phosphatase family metal-dependent hydrolase